MFHKIYPDACACNTVGLADCQPLSCLPILILLNLTTALNTVYHNVPITQLHGVAVISHLAFHCSNHPFCKDTP